MLRKQAPVQFLTGITLMLLTLVSGCAYPEIVESVRNGPLPKRERVEYIDLRTDFIRQFPIGSKTAVAINSLIEAGFGLERNYPQRHLQINNLSVMWDGWRAFRKNGDKFEIAIQIDSKDGTIVDLRATVRKFFF